MVLMVPALRRRHIALWLILQARKRAAEASKHAHDDAALNHRELLLAAGYFIQDSGPQRRVVARTEGGWSKSTIANYVEKGDEITYRKNFRCTKKSFQILVNMLSQSGHITAWLPDVVAALEVPETFKTRIARWRSIRRIFRVYRRICGCSCSRLVRNRCVPCSCCPR